MITSEETIEVVEDAMSDALSAIQMWAHGDPEKTMTREDAEHLLIAVGDYNFQINRIVEDAMIATT